MLFRLGFSLLLSIGLALLLAWGWASSEELPPSASAERIGVTSAPASLD